MAKTTSCGDSLVHIVVHIVVTLHCFTLIFSLPYIPFVTVNKDEVVFDKAFDKVEFADNVFVLEKLGQNVGVI